MDDDLDIGFGPLAPVAVSDAAASAATETAAAPAADATSASPPKPALAPLDELDAALGEGLDGDDLEGAKVGGDPRSRPWTTEEDAMVRSLVEEHGTKRWSVIAASLPGRTGKQCRERWHNQLDPAIKKDIWAPEGACGALVARARLRASSPRCAQAHGSARARIRAHTRTRTRTRSPTPGLRGLDGFNFCHVAASAHPMRSGRPPRSGSSL